MRSQKLLQHFPPRFIPSKSTATIPTHPLLTYAAARTLASTSSGPTASSASSDPSHLSAGSKNPTISKRPVWIRNAKSATPSNVLTKNSPSSLTRSPNVHSPSPVTSSNYETDLYGTSSYLLDTHFAYNKLLESGFSNAQAASLVSILRDYSGNILKDQQCQFVKREEYLNADKNLQKRISDIFVDISVLRKGEMVTVGSEIDKMKLKLNSMSENFNGELNKISSNFRLDIYDHKSLNIGNNAAMEMKINKIDNKIDIEMATIRTKIEETQHNALKYIFGTIVSTLTVLFGIYRLVGAPK